MVGVSNVHLSAPIHVETVTGSITKVMAFGVREYHLAPATGCATLRAASRIGRLLECFKKLLCRQF